MNEKVLWYAVNGNGQGLVFAERPVREEHFKTWAGRMYGCYTMFLLQLESEGRLVFPPLKWTDEPVEIAVMTEIRL